VLVPSVARHLRNLARGVLAGRAPVLLEGATSSGKTSLVEFLAALTGHVCVRINNHEHTDVAEYLGSYVTCPATGRLLWACPSVGDAELGALGYVRRRGGAAAGAEEDAPWAMGGGVGGRAAAPAPAPSPPPATMPPLPPAGEPGDWWLHAPSSPREESCFMYFEARALAGAGAALVAFAELAKGAGEFKDIEERVGASAESLASLAIAANIAGVSVDDLGGQMNKLTKNLSGVDDESKAAGAALAALGIPTEAEYVRRYAVRTGRGAAAAAIGLPAPEFEPVPGR
jgi:hypothetical protein